MTKTSILLIPADDRPVSYLLPLRTGAINKNVSLFIPPREFLGNLHRPANITKILDWLGETLAKNRIDYIICALDTIAYGGLIPSRRCEDERGTILLRLEEFRRIIEGYKGKILAFSSIMRISDSNVNEEEKSYWDKYGKLIFNYSCLKHRGEDYSSIQALIPPDILDDYLKTRNRNFSINKIYLDWHEQGVFDFLAYTKDDTSEFGLNVGEAEFLEKSAFVHTGFDEVITLLLTRAISGQFNEKIRIFPVYSTPEGQNLVLRYEGGPLCRIIESHIRTCGAEAVHTGEEADIILLAHTPQKTQNDFALGEFPEGESKNSVNFCVNTIKNSAKPVILADVKNANGSDSLLVRELLGEEFDLYGYAGWNTASNSSGSALSMGITRYIAEKQGYFSGEDFTGLLFIRFLDDWGYQAIARQKPGSAGVLLDMAREMARGFNINPDHITLTFPWNRTFEVEISC